MASEGLRLDEGVRPFFAGCEQVAPGQVDAKRCTEDARRCPSRCAAMERMVGGQPVEAEAVWATVMPGPVDDGGELSEGAYRALRNATECPASSALIDPPGVQSFGGSSCSRTWHALLLVVTTTSAVQVAECRNRQGCKGVSHDSAHTGEAAETGVYSDQISKAAVGHPRRPAAVRQLVQLMWV